MPLLNGRPLSRTRHLRANRILEALAQDADVVAVTAARVAEDPTAQTEARDLYTVATLRNGRHRAFMQFAVHLAKPTGPPKPGARFTTDGLMTVRPQISAAVEDGRAPTVLTGNELLERVWERHRLVVAALLREHGGAVDSVLAAALERHDPGPKPPATPVQPPTDITTRLAATTPPAQPQQRYLAGQAVTSVPIPRTDGPMATVTNLAERRALRERARISDQPTSA